MANTQPPIVFSIRDNIKHTNYAIAENQTFAKVPSDLTLEADVPPEIRPNIVSATLTCDGITFTDTTRPWRLGQTFALTKGNHSFIATFMDNLGVTATDIRHFTTNEASSGQTNPPPATTVAKKGVCMYDSDPLSLSASLRDQGITDLRFWVQAANYEKWIPTANAKNCVAWKKAGFEPLPTVTIPQVPPSLAVAKEFWKRVAGVFSGKVNAIQCHNEVNLPSYFPGSLQQAFDLVAVPAAEALHAEGITFISPSISEHPEDFREFASYGLIHLCQSVGGEIDVHSYGVNSTDQLIRMNPALSLVNGVVPLNETEFNIHSGSMSGWKVEFPKTWAYARSRFKRLFYYRLLPNLKTPAGGQSLLKKDGKKNQPYYDTYKSLQ